MDRPQNQHLIPKVYLKYFRIQEFPSEYKVWVFDFENNHTKRTESKNVNSNFFKKYDYYNSDDFTEDGYGLEILFGEIERDYHLIMQNIIDGVDLSKSVREKLLTFLISAKLRSPIWRSESYKNRLINIAFIKTGRTTDLYSDEKLKEMHLSMVLDRQLLNDLMNTFLLKKWLIYKITDSHSFITSDNPGFSINLDNDVEIPNPYWKNLKHDSVIFFPLSSELCLVIAPFNKGTNLKINAFDVPIGFLNAEDKLIERININTFITKSRLVVSNSTAFFDSLDLEN